MPESNKAFGQRVKDFRTMQLQQTQEQAAGFFGISYATLLRVEHGKGCGALTKGKIEKRIAQAKAA